MKDFQLSKVVVIDIETNKLDNPDKLWVVVLKTEKEVLEFTSENGIDWEQNNELKSVLNEYNNKNYYLVGHNIIDFDVPQLKRFFSFSWKEERLVDTLVISRFLNYRINDGHSLEAWGKRLGFEKIEFSEFDKFSDDMVRYCRRDVELTWKLIEFFEPYVKEFWKSIWLEHQAALFCKNHLERNGFKIDVNRLEKYRQEISGRLDELLSLMRNEFEPFRKKVREFYPRVKKDGSVSVVGLKKLGEECWEFVQCDRKLSSLFEVEPDEKIEVYRIEEFNPESQKHVIDALWKAGWKPVNKTEGHKKAEKEGDKEKLKEYKYWGWKIDEENLSTLPESAPQSAKYLKEYLTLSSRLSLLESWKDLIKEDNRIHGKFLHIGTWTHRMAHQNPNMGNVPSRGLYGEEFRSLWTVSNPDMFLVGTDADGIQMRAFAHYVDDKKLIDIIVSGEDVHSLHAEYLGGVERDKAKTFIYAFLFGAQAKKVSTILGCSVKEAEERIQFFLSNYPNLKKMYEEEAPIIAQRGWFRAIDGRKIVCNQPRLVLVGLCQSFEAVVMKLAACLWMRELDRKNVPYRFVNFVHDEFQTETYSEDLANEVGRIQAKAIEEAGRRLGSNCPLSGSYQIGKNWKETH